jgi:small ligand-binding sensory domain FIST
MPFAAALSTETDTAAALDEVAAKAMARLAAPPELAVAFFSPHHAEDAPRIAGVLNERLTPTCLIGCAGEAVVGEAREVEKQPALSLWLANWHGKVALSPFHLTPSRTADGLSLLGWPDDLLDADPRDSALLVVGDPYTFPAAEVFLPHVNEVYPGLRAIGGMASGSIGPGQTPLLYGGEALAIGAVGVMLRGPSGLRGVVSQGCRPIGRHQVVTKADGNVIIELGGKPPLEYLRGLYTELGPHDQGLFQSGLHVGLVIDEYKEAFGRGDFLLRNLAGLDKKTGALAITDNVRVGQTVQFHVRDADSADEELRAMLRADESAHPARPSGALLFSCNGRGTRMFDGPDHDAAAVQAERGPVPLAGFFCAGELGPVGGKNFLHGFTASLALFD